VAVDLRPSGAERSLTPRKLVRGWVVWVAFRWHNIVLDWSRPERPVFDGASQCLVPPKLNGRIGSVQLARDTLPTKAYNPSQTFFSFGQPGPEMRGRPRPAFRVTHVGYQHLD
jgi:hypothetical protein